MGEECGVHGRCLKCIQILANLGRGHLRDISIDGKIILKYLDKLNTRF